MTVLTFPTSPIIGQRYNAPNEIQYVFDGVKWIVETVATTSAAVTNSVQDRVAPMFVAGPNTGIAFTYNAGTNVMSASVTAVNGDQLVNGASSLTLESNGNITAPAFTIPNAVGTNGQVLKWPSSGSTLVWSADSSTTNKLVNGVNQVVLGTDGVLTAPGTITAPNLIVDDGNISFLGNGSGIQGAMSFNLSTNNFTNNWNFSQDGKLVKLEGIILTAGGQFNICTILDAGSGYTGDDPLPATTTGGTGTGMTVVYGYGLSGQLTNVSVIESGQGYTNGDVISVSGGTGTFTLTQYNSQVWALTNNFVQSDWQFNVDGSLTFPDATVQTTAWTGIPGPYADDAAAQAAGVAVGNPYHKTGTSGQVFVRLA